MSLLTVITEQIRSAGPITVADYMQLALYHPELGYYARSAQRSGKAGDFYTSVDVGPLFGELLARQFGEMWRIDRGLGAGDRGAGTAGRESGVVGREPEFMLVEAGAGNGRLMRDVLDAVQANDPDFYEAVRVYLVEASAAARSAQGENLRPHATRVAGSGDELPDAIVGVIFANELLDALPCHVVVSTKDGLEEVRIDVEGGVLVERLGPLSTPDIAQYLERVGAHLAPGWRAEVNLAAPAWMREAAARLQSGFLVLIDYGHEADELYSATHAAGTLRTFRRHAVDAIAADRRSSASWLDDPGGRDLTAHVDFTSIRMAAQDAGLVTLGFLDQTYFLLGLGIADLAGEASSGGVGDVKRRMAIKTLLLPGGLGSTHKVLLLGKHVGSPVLRGCSGHSRVT